MRMESMTRSATNFLTTLIIRGLSWNHNGSVDHYVSTTHSSTPPFRKRDNA